jgi:polyisoprenoid-binding protein YceI
MNVPTEGVFKKIAAQINFDPANAAQGSAQVSIDIASFELGDKMYNDQVTGKDWFDAKTYPQATFVSTAIAPSRRQQVQRDRQADDQGQDRKADRAGHRHAGWRDADV